VAYQKYINEYFRVNVLNKVDMDQEMITDEIDKPKSKKDIKA